MLLKFCSPLLVLLALSMTINPATMTATTTTPSMLIIRHGRSRVRHINENDHIRWGLQAFDNLTLDDYDTTTSTDPSSTVDLLNDASSSSSSSSDLVGSQLFGSDFWLGSDTNNNLNGNVSSNLINQASQPIGNSKRKGTADFPMENIMNPSQQVSST